MKKTLFLMLLGIKTYAQTLILPSGTTTLMTSEGMVIDNRDFNMSSLDRGLRFGSFSGEGIASRRVLSLNPSVVNLYGLDFYTANTRRMSITNGGSVGIGTTEPQTKLEVTNGAISLFNTTANKLWIFEYDQPNGYFYIDEYGDGRRLIIKNGGNVGIGASNPTAKLEVDGFTKLGTDAPKIKVKKLLSTTGANQGDITTVAHELNSTKIISATVLIEYSTGKFVPHHYTIVGGLEFHFLIKENDFEIRTKSGNSINILTKPIKILVTYEE